jgi:ribonucleoside-diphosphate reductase alpha chain
MSNGIKVKKRDGRIESLDLDKMHLMVDEATKGLAGVSASQVEMKSGIQFYDGITTAEIQEILIKAASDLIDLEHPNYQFVAARLLLFSLRKQLYGKMRELPDLETHIMSCTNIEVYDKEIFLKYSKEEIAKANSYIDHHRDFLFTYAGLRQVADKYLVQDRSTGGVYETPQFMYIMIALTIFAEYPKETRMTYVKRYYDAISKHKINIPTPIMAGVRTPLRQFASCVLVEASLLLIWLSADMLHKGRASVSTQAESAASTVKSEVEKFNTQVLYHSSKNLRALSDAALKMAFEVEAQLSTSQSGTKKSKT